MLSNNILTKLEKIKQWNAKNVKEDDRGVPRLVIDDAKTPSPSRLMRMIGLYTQTEIPKHMIMREIRDAL